MANKQQGGFGRYRQNPSAGCVFIKPGGASAYCHIPQNKKGPRFGTPCYLAESEGFEPPEGFPSTVFKTAAFGRSASSPESGAIITQADFIKKVRDQICRNSATDTESSGWAADDPDLVLADQIDKPTFELVIELAQVVTEIGEVVTYSQFHVSTHMAIQTH